jgi:hypothetical protein
LLNFDGMELRPEIAPGCLRHKSGLALARAAQR